MTTQNHAPQDADDRAELQARTDAEVSALGYRLSAMAALLNVASEGEALALKEAAKILPIIQANYLGRAVASLDSIAASLDRIDRALRRKKRKR